MNRMYRSVISAAGLAGGAGEDITSGLLMHYKMNEGSGTTLNDSSGNGYNVTLSGAAWVAGKVGSNALLFDGVDDYVDLTPHIGANTWGQFTLACWYKSTNPTTSDDEYLWVHGNGSSSSPWYIIIAVTDDAGNVDQIRTILRNGGSDQYYYSGSGNTVTNQAWRHIAVVRSATQVITYIDGAAVATATDTLAGVTIDPSTNEAYFGDFPGNTEQVDGSLDDWRLYTRALTAAQISYIYNGGAGRES